MMIDNRIKAIAGVYSSNSIEKRKNAEKSDSTQPYDEIVLSSTGQSFGQILHRLKAGEDVRQNKVEQYADMINSGQYQVDSSSIANKMLNMRF